MEGSLWLTLIATCILLKPSHSILTTTPKPTTTTTTTTMPSTVTNQCSAQVDLIFALDSSTSVGNDNYDKMKDFVKKFLHSANIDGGEVRVGLVSYSSLVTVEFQLNSYTTKADVFAAVDNIPWRYGSTNTADGLQTIHEDMFTEGNGDRPGVPNICIIMTDGVSNINYRRTIPEAKEARQKGIHIYVIGIGLKDLKEVNEIVSEPASLNVFAVNTTDELEGLEEKVLVTSCPVDDVLRPRRNRPVPTTTTTIDDQVEPERPRPKPTTKPPIDRTSEVPDGMLTALIAAGALNERNL
ncbi:cartilage matrix protein-like isoform X2 [Ostrea edulis]|uniref:cartilage matrix protein-like isoform X2 n=1 Tax=Ostrea edulis TaxID=37623 RepID=UPI0024AF58C2|nr:cartilage matrix protein-like isoform X2 [Ostrea edulis]